MKTLLCVLLCLTITSTLHVYGQLGVDNTDPHPSSVLDLNSTDKGLLIPRMTSVQREAITSPANSLLVFDTTLNRFFYYHNGQWQSFDRWTASGSDIYYNSGNAGIGTIPPAGHSSYAFQFLGTAQTLMASKSGTEQYLGSNVYYDGVWKKRITGLSSLIGQSAGRIYFYTSPTGDAGSTITWGNPKITISDAGNLGIGVSPNSPLQFASTVAKRKIVLWEAANNDHQFYGFGMTGNDLAYQTQSALADHVFYSGVSSSASTELMRVKGNGALLVGSNGDLAQIGSKRVIIESPSFTDTRGIGFYANDGTKNPRAWIQHVTASDGSSQSVKFGSSYSTASSTNDWIFESGNVGMGIYPSATKLHLYTGISSAIKIARPSSNTFGFEIGGDGFGSYDYTASRYLWRSTGTTLLLNEGGGNVGIGGTPSHRFTVKNSGTSTIGIGLVRSGGTQTIAGLRENASGNGELYLYNSAGTLYAYISDGIGTATDWVATSDRRLKENVRPIGSQLATIISISRLARNYDRKDNGNNENGFIAQELEKVVPEYVVVPDDPGKMYSVNYAKMVVPLFKGTAELADEIEKLKEKEKMASEEIDGLKKEIEELKALLKSKL